MGTFRGPSDFVAGRPLIILSRSSPLSFGTTAAILFGEGLTATSAQNLPPVTSGWVAAPTDLICLTAVLEVHSTATGSLTPFSGWAYPVERPPCVLQRAGFP